MSDPCPLCGKDRVLVGRVHNCLPPSLPNSIVTPPVKSEVKPTKSRAKLPTAAARIEELEAEIRLLKRELARRVDTTPAAAVDTTALKRELERRKVVSTAECSVCKARREAKTAAQKKWRQTKSQSNARTATKL